jgi:hypothetical protein
MWWRRNRRTAPVGPEEPFDTVAWIDTLPEHAQLFVSRGGRYQTRLPVSRFMGANYMLEEAVIAAMGPGRYTVMPVYDGTMHAAITIHVGRAAASGALAMSALNT